MITLINYLIIVTRQVVTHIRESQRFESIYTLQGKPDQNATHFLCLVHKWSSTIRISRSSHIATFHESPTELDRVSAPEKKEFLTASPARRLTDLRVPI
jgi:hypothetical protein